MSLGAFHEDRAALPLVSPQRSAVNGTARHLTSLRTPGADREDGMKKTDGLISYHYLSLQFLRNQSTNRKPIPSNTYYMMSHPHPSI